ncbi:MAG TPA: response regulator [Holophaga sp.]|nr:response regulator [Holophaga sp.]
MPDESDGMAPMGRLQRTAPPAPRHWFVQLVAECLSPEDQSSLEPRLLQGMCLINALAIFLIVLPANISQGLSFAINAVTVLIALGALAIYTASRRGTHLYKTAFLLLLGGLDTLWFINGGSQGGVGLYFFQASTYLVIFFTDRLRWNMLALFVINSVGLFAFERIWPSLVIPETPNARFTDLLVGFLLVNTLGIVMLWVIVGGFRRERALMAQAADAHLGIEKELEESRALFASLINSTDDLVFLVDGECFAIGLCNSATQNCLREAYGVEIQTGITFDELLPQEEARLWRELFNRVLTEGSIAVDRPFAVSSRYYAFSINRLERKGKPLAIAVFGKDITRMKRAEEDRQKIETQLWQSQKMESLGQLAGGVAHDFNNMLGGIIGYADLLLGTEEDPRRQGHLKAILGAAERSSEMTRKLLAFGRRGKNVVEPVDMNLLIRESHEMLKPSMKQDVDVVLELADIPRIDADPSQINQILLNLVLNANEAIEGRGTITIRTWIQRLDGDAAKNRNLRPGDYATLSVSDTGVGMSEDTRRRIFEPFFTTKTDGDVLGSGLGLATVYGIVHSHHGDIQVDSVLGHGASFTALFPKGVLGEQLAKEIKPVRQGRGTILIVEDEPVMMRFSQAALRELGYASMPAWDGVEGIRQYQEKRHEISAVMLDLKMPKMGGRDCFIELQKLDPNVAVLICTGYGDNEEVQELISRGARGLLKKPFRVAELAEHLGRIIPSEN